MSAAKRLEELENVPAENSHLTGYQQAIAALGLRQPPDLIEEWMRTESPTLDHLSRSEFNRLARGCAKAIEADIEGAEKFAQVMGCSAPRGMKDVTPSRAEAAVGLMFLNGGAS